MRAVSLAGFIVAFSVCAIAGSARAHEGAGGNVGLGVGIGAPTAVTLDLAPNPWTAFEVALGLHDVANDQTYAHFVFKGDLVRLASGPSVVVPLYLGAGAFVHDHGVTDFGA